MDTFSLDPRLAADCHWVGDLALSRVLLLDDCRYPWVLLVPRRADVVELFQLAHEDRVTLLEESCRLGALLMAEFRGDKLNIGALGNLVSQLHLHHVVRYEGDPAWPGPVWGHSSAQGYAEHSLNERLDLIRNGLGIEVNDVG